ncbi:variant surface glycoprotein (VSG, atypical), putative [Trypanosoma equiperdum]|uniref:Variant surface glycoprotein (VSG, atypical), putative n=2 Tax=Trypanozoon TaxID=39700 RepID=Q380X6_TRYB2|nr:variant surface glycoprotein [Trypanosoma brucei brucei TREU927]EAN80655.1 variant surface glycoprotein (VSG, atypical), putative [Trypanosoma brucei brucei TREU927]SCU68692.1 variant surface glycoprotein (VSG, atypical), putative [Trypanosoma equiperdum]
MQATMSAVAPGVILAIAALKQARGVTDGDNAAIFKPLCAALQLADVKPTFEPPIQANMPEPLDLYRLNMSIAPKDWRAKFLNQGNKAASTPAEVPTDENDEELKARWKTWADTAVFLATDNNEKDLKANYGLATATAGQIEAIRPTIHDITEAARAIYTADSDPGPAPDADELLQKEIAQAVYGQEQWGPEELTANKVLSGPDTGYTTACGGGGTQKPQNTVAGTIICVCGTGNTQSKKPCHKKQTTQTAWQATNIPNRASWGNLRNVCPKATKTKITAHGLRELVAAAKTIANTQGNNVFIGSEGENTCNGNAAGACVKITGGAPSGNLKDDAIPWINKLEAVADKLAARDNYNSEQRRKKAAIADLISRAKAVTKRAHYLFQFQKTAKTAAAGEATEGKVSKGDCKQYTTNSTCPKNDCKWDITTETTGEYCKPKPETETTETGEKTNEG